MTSTHPRIAALLFDTPHMVHPPKLTQIVAGLEARLGLASYDPNDEEDDDPNEMADDDDYASSDGVATIQAYGTLVKRTVGMDAMSGLTSYESLSKQLMDAATDPNCQAILLDVDSYGGECAGAFDLSDLIYEIRKSIPVYAVANSFALSAGYAIASSAEKLYVTQDGSVGSIGVIAVHADQSGYDDKMGVKYTAITFGDRKNDFSPHMPLSKDANAELQADVDRLGEMFVNLVSRNRRMTAESVKATQAGLYSGGEAISAGLADYIGTKADAMAALSQKISGRRVIALPGQSVGASASAAAISKEDTTNVSTAAVIPQADAAQPPDIASIRKEAQAQAKAEYAANVAQINALCKIAGQEKLAVDFINQGLTVNEVQEKLLSSRASASAATELQTSADPLQSVGANDANRLIRAVTRRLAGQNLKPKVRSY